ncbi:aspartate kinase [Candidatus Acetothermia bacterium]|nr:aspartate kinase [Candidatus Acetothermia bacterium]
MAVIVQKYGGSSVATPKHLKNVAQRVAQRKREGHDVVVVVSARGETTDELIELAQELLPEPTAAGSEYDALLATGEKEAAALMAMALIAEGLSAISMNGAQAGILTDSIHSKARISGFDARSIQKELARGKVVIVAGFQGADSNGRITTLGRGGSDITAAALAAGLGAARCEIFKDVLGFYTADPRQVPEAAKLHELTYDEAMELASVGAAITHPRAIEIARRYKIPIAILHTFSEAEGTWIKESLLMENVHAIRGVVADKNIVKISILGVPDKPGVAANFFVPLGKARIKTDMIVQNISHEGRSDISFVVAQSDAREALRAVQQAAAPLGSVEIQFDPEIAKVSIVGGGIASHAEVAGEMFECFSKEKINIEMISTSEIKISCAVRKQQADQAVRALHNHFGLQNQKLEASRA